MDADERFLLVRERNGRGQADSDSHVEDIEFVYADADSFLSEISELFTYSENSEFAVYRKSFEELFCNVPNYVKWEQLSQQNRENIVHQLLDRIDCAASSIRTKAAQALLYVALGVYGETSASEGLELRIKENAYLLYECGAFDSLYSLLLFELEAAANSASAARKPALSIADSCELRVVLSTMYVIIESMRLEDPADTERMQSLRKQLIAELSEPKQNSANASTFGTCSFGESDGQEELFIVLLLNMVTRFANGAAAHFPIRKVCLLIWKTVLITLGGVDDLHRRRVALRNAANLHGFSEDTHAVCRSMRSSSPPPSAAEQLDPIHGGLSRRNASLAGGQNQPGGLASGVLLRKSNLTKQSSLLDESALAYADESDSSAGSVQSAMETDANDVIERGQPSPKTPSASATASTTNSSNDADEVFTRPAEEAQAQPDGGPDDAPTRARRPLPIDPSAKQDDVDTDAVSDNGSNSNSNTIDSLSQTLVERGEPSGRERLRGATDSESSGTLSSSDSTHWLSPGGEALKERRLPWRPKVRRKDLEAFVEATRDKFAGLRCAPHAHVESLAGLPLPIHESVRVLQQHVYVSLADLQVQREEEMARFPLSRAEAAEDVQLSATELLYRAMLPNISQYVISLLKVLLAAAPASKTKADSVNLISDVLPLEMPTTIAQSVRLSVDVNRHKEVIVKAVSGILLLLLKSFKLNHIYQFEFLAQHLVFANCIPLILKFLNQNLLTYVGARQPVAALDFPDCLFVSPSVSAELEASAAANMNASLDVSSLDAQTQPDADVANTSTGVTTACCWRNMFACINLLRVLNKLTKWKYSRVMMLVVFKSAPILKRALKLRHPLLQLYVLKLLKQQAKHLGRQWRKSNMKVLSAIYAKVRHRYLDDWAYGNDMDTRPWDFQVEECALRNAIERFNNRRYLHPEHFGLAVCTMQIGAPLSATSGNNTGAASGNAHAEKDADRDHEQPQANTECVLDLRPTDNNPASYLQSTLAQTELPAEWMANYESWLQREVFENNTDWDAVIRH